MAYTMTHILIAKKILEYIDSHIDYPTYILGTIAPDAVHAAKDFSVEQKEQSHFLVEGARWGKITSEDDFERWLENIKKFYLENCDRYNRDYFLGYIVHLLVDVYSCKKVMLLFIFR